MGVIDTAKRIFNSGGAENNALRQKVQSKLNGVTRNPFISNDGTLLNPYINYQRALNSSGVSTRAKEYIHEATGLSPLSTREINTDSTAAPIEYKTGTRNASGTSNKIVASAEKYIGTPYVWGGESASEGGMDCSGFVYNALKGAGYKIGRTTAQGYRSYGSTVNKADMQPGDLVFFGKNNKASHIGIYIGNGKMIHSSGNSKNTKAHPGKGVSVANIDYRSDFLEARRY